MTSLILVIQFKIKFMTNMLIIGEYRLSVTIKILNKRSMDLSLLLDDKSNTGNLHRCSLVQSKSAG